MVNIANLSDILTTINSKTRSIIVTIPQWMRWKDFERNLRSVANYTHNLEFRVHDFPNGIHKGDKFYVVHNNVIKGWMEIVGFTERGNDCEEDDKLCSKYIEYSGPFHYIDEIVSYNDFQGYRYFDLNEYKKNKDIFSK
jgi:hypothetical protein